MLLVKWTWKTDSRSNFGQQGHFIEKNIKFVSAVMPPLYPRTTEIITHTLCGVPHLRWPFSCVVVCGWCSWVNLEEGADVLCSVPSLVSCCLLLCFDQCQQQLCSSTVWTRMRSKGGVLSRTPPAKPHENICKQTPTQCVGVCQKDKLLSTQCCFYVSDHHGF